MTKYVSLITFTDTGIKNLRKTTARAQAFQEKMEKEGITTLITLWTVGQYDLFHVFEAPDDQAAAVFAYTLSSLGNVRTNTMRAFNAEEMADVIQKVQTPYDLLKDQH